MFRSKWRINLMIVLSFITWQSFIYIYICLLSYDGSQLTVTIEGKGNAKHE